jgi:hypothetical protein
VGPASIRLGPSTRSGRAQLRADGQLPVVGRVFPAPVAAKVPEVIFLFWVVKILTTGIGFGDGPTALVFALAVLVLVSYLAIARPDIQRSHVEGKRSIAQTPEYAIGAPGLEVE